MKFNALLYLLFLVAVSGKTLSFVILSVWKDVPHHQQHLELSSAADFGPCTDISLFVTYLPILQIDTGW